MAMVIGLVGKNIPPKTEEKAVEVEIPTQEIKVEKQPKVSRTVKKTTAKKGR